MKEKIMITMLTQDNVLIQKQNYVTVNGVNYTVGQQWNKAYVNSKRGRVELETEITEPYLSAILAMWGDKPTVEEITQ